MGNDISDVDLERFSTFVAKATGLAFPQSRWNDLCRGLTAVTIELGCSGITECAHRLMSSPLDHRQIEMLASNLTVGETYFFREKPVLDVVSQEIVPAILDARRRTGNMRLRIWSTACCTGEEPYSIAILLRESVPDLDDWNLTLLATDINPQFLRAARTGVYGNWSFRDTPPWLKQRHFIARPDGKYEVKPDIKRMVRFAHLNLADDIYPSLTNDTNAMDIIFCRNVLMYFTPDTTSNVIRKLHQAQVNGGWLIVGQCELSQIHSASYTATNLHGVVCHQRNQATVTSKPPSQFTSQPSYSAFSHITFSPTAAAENSDPRASSQTLPTGSDNIHDELSHDVRQDTTIAPDVRARALANQGNLDDALGCCNQWVADDKLNPAGRYLQAVILQEQGETSQAIQALRAALYLDPHFLLAHFALGNIARDHGRAAEADRHFRNTAQLLHRYMPDDVVPESDGITVRRLGEIIDSLRTQETVP